MKYKLVLRVHRTVIVETDDISDTSLNDQLHELAEMQCGLLDEIELLDYEKVTE